MQLVKYLKKSDLILKAYGYGVTVPDDLGYITRINAKWQGKEENMHFAVFTVEQWNNFSDNEEASQEFAFGGDFHNHINDSILIQDLFSECRRKGSRSSPRKRNAKKQNGCLRKTYKYLSKEKSEKKRKDIPI